MYVSLKLTGINTPDSNLMSLYTGENCQINSITDAFTGHVINANCSVSNDTHAFNLGCQIVADRPNTYGTEFNKGKST